MWLVAVAALAVLVIAGLFAASRSPQLRSQGYTASPLPVTTATAAKGKVTVETNDKTNCKVTSNKDKDAKNPKINCGDTCSAKYDEDLIVDLYVHAADGYEVDKWENKEKCDGCDKSTSNTCSVLVKADGNTCKVTCKKKTSSPTPSP